MKAMKKVKKEDLVIKKEIISILSEREIEQVRGGGTTDNNGDNGDDGNDESENGYSCTTRCVCLSKKNDCNKPGETQLYPYLTTLEQMKPHTYGPGCRMETINACFYSTGCNFEVSVNVCAAPIFPGQN